MKILVTGGCGFIGTNFTQKQLEVGNEVINIDKLTYAGNIDNFSDYKENKNYIFIGGKNLGYNSLEYLVKKKFYPSFVVPNKDDLGKDNIFNKSVLKFAKKKKIKDYQSSIFV